MCELSRSAEKCKEGVAILPVERDANTWLTQLKSVIQAGVAVDFNRVTRAIS